MRLLPFATKLALSYDQSIPRSVDPTTTMPDLPPKDRPDAIQIGPIGPIPVFHDDDPRQDEDRRAWSAAKARAQTLHTVDELLAGLNDPDWRVRHEVIPRLIAKGRDDQRTVPTLLQTLAGDKVWQVRDIVAMSLHAFERELVTASLRRAMGGDESSDVRWSARYSLLQLGETFADDDP
jgi:hypothetical protein